MRARLIDGAPFAAVLAVLIVSIAGDGAGASRRLFAIALVAAITVAWWLATRRTRHR